MGYSLHIRNFRLPGVDQSSIGQDQLTYFSVIELPFRLRLGRFFRQSINPDGTVEIACLNRIDLPKPSGYSIEELPRKRDRHLLNTRLVVIENVVPMKEKEIENIRVAAPFPLSTDAAHLLKQKPGSQFLVSPILERPLSAIRRFIELYFMYCPPMYNSDEVRPIWLHDYLSQGIVYGLCLRPSGSTLPNRFIKVLLSSDDPRQEERNAGAVFWHDAPLTQRRRFAKSLREGEDPSLADQLLLLSNSYQAQHNMEMAVITVVAALEAALFVFAQQRLEPKLGKSLTENFLREQGASMLVEALPLLLFSKENMPDPKVFEGVKQAITARNHIMHGKLDRAGKPKHLNMGHLGASVSACRQLLQAFQREAKR